MRTILFLLIAISLVSCSSSSGHRVPTHMVTTKADSITVDTTHNIQVVHSNGMVENIPDKLNLKPNIGDTIIILEVFNLFSDGTSFSDRRIWGKFSPKMPKNYEGDSSYLDYYPVKVIKN